MSTHLLSLPAETLDSITNYLPHPVDALNLSMTCRYFNQHLSTQHNNKFWHAMFSGGHSGNIYVHRPDTDSFSIGKPGLAYDPAQDYKPYVLRALLQNGCQFCLKHMVPSSYQKGRDSRMCQVHGFKICMGCLKEHTTTISKFRGLGLDISTSPPKSSTQEVYNMRVGRKISVTFYWKFDIESLCIAQFGIGLAHLQRRKEEEKLAKEAAKKANPTPLRKLRDQAKSTIAESVWTIWNGGDYKYPRERWGKDVTKEQLLAWLFLRQEDEEPQNANVTGTLHRYLKTIRSKLTLADKDEAWYDLVARDLLEGLKDRHSAEDGYRALAFSWHTERITEIFEQLPPHMTTHHHHYHCWYEHSDGRCAHRHELQNFLLHMEAEHPVFYWSSEEWEGLPWGAQP